LFSANNTESFTIDSGSPTITTTGGGDVTVWRFFADDKLNNGGTPDCSNNSIKGWLCADTAKNGSITPFTIAAGKNASFNFTGTYTGTTPVSQLDLMASGCVVTGTCDSNNGNKWAISGTGTGTTPTPEPASMLLLGLGLACAPFLRRRRS
jgi:hypothetical protein